MLRDGLVVYPPDALIRSRQLELLIPHHCVTIQKWEKADTFPKRVHTSKQASVAAAGCRRVDRGASLAHDAAVARPAHRSTAHALPQLRQSATRSAPARWESGGRECAHGVDAERW